MVNPNNLKANTITKVSFYTINNGVNESVSIKLQSGVEFVKLDATQEITTEESGKTMVMLAQPGESLVSLFWKK